MSGEQMGSASALTVYREKPLTEAEQALANALASQVGMRIQNCQLFSETLDQAGTVIDNEAYGNLPHYPDVQIPRGLSGWKCSQNLLHSRVPENLTASPCGTAWSICVTHWRSFNPFIGC